MVPEITSLLLQQAQAFSSAQYPGSSIPSSNHPHHRSSQPENVSQPCQILLLGIESHVCVLQTATDLLSLGHRVYVLADGISSCNAGERGVALDRLRQEGAIVTTSESVLFEMVGDAGRGEFKEVAGLVKRWKGETGEAVRALCGGLYGGVPGVPLGDVGGKAESGMADREIEAAEGRGSRL